ncbi:SRPBCC domain-containing protein [Arthrobacter citreus]|uniref:SRPBCC family protein n=1 Tax=Arthrobacter TaxID=1663 RepID=UPI001265A296|nr:hypothetical protein [Arthrobacter gandavensis]
MGDQIRVAAQARCSPEQLWQALVDHRAAWWPEMDFTASPGAPLTERFSAHDDDGGGSGSDGGGSDSGRDDGSDSDGRNGPGTRATGTVLAVARERLLSFRWTMPGWNSHTIVSFTLDAGAGPDAEADYTDVVVTESGLGSLTDGAEVARTHTGDWSDHLATLIRLAEKGSPA